MNSSNATLLSEIESDLSRIDELKAKANKISESIQAQLYAIYAEINVIRESSDARISAFVESVTFDYLCTEKGYEVVSKVFWNSGRGIHFDVYAWVKAMFPDTYVLNTRFSDAGSDATYIEFEVSIPAVKDESKLERTAVMLEQVYRAGANLSDEYEIQILEDSLAQWGGDWCYVKRDEDGSGWLLCRSYHDDVSYDNLLEALRAAPTYR